MAWQWVNDLLTVDHKKKMYWDARCPYMLCPSNQPERGAKKPRLKFIQKVSFLVYQYRCKDCGNIINFSIEMPDDGNINYKRMNPGLSGLKPDYKFHV